MQFKDRREAGQLLAQALLQEPLGKDLLVLGIPRGGVVVAAEVARALRAPLDVFIARKIGSPWNPELALGAVASAGEVILDRDMIARLGISSTYIAQAIAQQRQEIERRAKLYRGDRPPEPIEGRTVILVDDGVATGATMRAGIAALRTHAPREIIAAVPVASREAFVLLNEEADRVICLLVPDLFWAVGMFYRDFEQVSDQEVVALLREQWRDGQEGSG